jgi:hypothetical protein
MPQLTKGGSSFSLTSNVIIPSNSSPPSHTMSLTFGPPSGDTYTFSDISDTVITLTSPNRPFAVWDQPGGVEEPKPAAGSGTNNPVFFRVYSKNLIQTSRVFEAALTGGWKESSSGDVVNSDGVHNINAEGWDPEALSITLNAIHNRTKAIPSTITIEMLCKVAVLVDYYELHDALSFLFRSGSKPCAVRSPFVTGGT